MYNIKHKEAAEIIETPGLTELQDALLKARVKIFDSEDVDEYQEKAVNRKAKAFNLMTLGLAVGLMLLAICFVLPFLSALLHLSWPDGPACILLAVGAALALTSGVMASIWSDQPRPLYSWQTISYTAASDSGQFHMPQEVRALAVQLPVENLWVEFLGCDPFLVAVDWDGALYYIAVWDEKGFRC